MCLSVNSSKQLLYGTTPVLGKNLKFTTISQPSPGKNLKYFIINYELAKYLTTLTIVIDFAGVAMKQSENPMLGMIQYSF